MLPQHHVLHGTHRVVLQSFPDNFFDSLVTDPPYGIRFMNKHWDYDVPSVEDFQSILRVLKPGAYALIACGTRTQHRMICAAEDAGFEVRDIITWHYGSGFPKSMDISKAIDKEKGLRREVVGKREHPTLKDKSKCNEPTSAFHTKQNIWTNEWDITAPASEEAAEWTGYGTALKPATELWTLCRKPLSEKTVAQNVLKWGTGGLNIDGSRIPLNGEVPPSGSAKNVFDGNEYSREEPYAEQHITPASGRYPSNLILDEFTGTIMDAQAPVAGAFAPRLGNYAGDKTTNIYGKYAHNNGDDGASFYDDLGGASRFFYCAKASPSERNYGLEGLQLKQRDLARVRGQAGTDNPYNRGATPIQNFHPSVKPVSLMRYLCKLITPRGGGNIGSLQWKWIHWYRCLDGRIFLYRNRERGGLCNHLPTSYCCLEKRPVEKATRRGGSQKATFSYF